MCWSARSSGVFGAPSLPHPAGNGSPAAIEFRAENEFRAESDLLQMNEIPQKVQREAHMF